MTAAPPRTERRRILLAVDHRRNREVLAGWLEHDASLAVADGRDDGFDVVVFDGPAFARERDWLRQTRAELAPVYLPCLLITPHRQVSMVTSDLWRDVDELLTTPLRGGELRVRLERLLAIRDHSLRAARQLRDLTRSNTDLQQFAFVAAHELSTPLTVVIGVIETVNARYGDALPEDVANLLTAARSSSHRLQHLIEDLLAYSRADQALDAAPVELAALLPEALAGLAAQIELTGTVVESDGLPVVLGDASQLRLVFSNLVGNAIKYRRPGVVPRVRIEATRQAAEWCISITDNGIGIDPEHAERVFGMFARERPNGERPGSGIGLALCKRIIERHGGQIWVEPAEGGGTVAKFTLPAA
jgi:signal transduction histidine kinase